MRSPGYPLFISFLTGLWGNPVTGVVGMQVMLAIGTAYLAQIIYNAVSQQDGYAVFLLTLFNPLVLFYTLRVLPEILFTFLVILHVFAIIKVTQGPSLKLMGLAGLSLALCAAVRPNGLYILPLSFIYILADSSTKTSLMQRGRTAMIFGLACILFVGSLFVFMWHKTGTASLTNERYVRFALHENFVMLEKRGTNLADSQARKALEKRVSTLAEVPYEELAGMDEGDKHVHTMQVIKDLTLSYQLSEVLWAVVRSTAVFLFDYGTSSWLAIAQTEQISAGQFINLVKSLLSGDLPSTSQQAINFFFYSLFTLLAISLRTLSVAGVVTIFKLHKQQAVYLFSLVVLFAITAAFIGNGRYRLPVDPILAILAGHAIHTVYNRIRKHKGLRS